MRAKRRTDEDEMVPLVAETRRGTPVGEKVKEGRNQNLSGVKTDRQTEEGPSGTERPGGVLPTYPPGSGLLDVWSSWRDGPQCSWRHGSRGMLDGQQMLQSDGWVLHSSRRRVGRGLSWRTETVAVQLGPLVGEEGAQIYLLGSWDRTISPIIRGRKRHLGRLQDNSGWTRVRGEVMMSWLRWAGWRALP